MKRKLNFLIFIITITFFSIVNINADTKEYSCTYRNRDNNDDKYVLTYEVAGNELNVIGCKHNGTNCNTSAYRFEFKNVESDTHTCPSSIEVEETSGIKKISWVGQHKGQYVYSPQWECLYDSPKNKTAKDYTKKTFYSFKFDYLDDKIRIIEANKHNASDLQTYVAVLSYTIKNSDSIVRDIETYDEEIFSAVEEFAENNTLKLFSKALGGNIEMTVNIDVFNDTVPLYGEVKTSGLWKNADSLHNISYETKISSIEANECPKATIKLNNNKLEKIIFEKKGSKGVIISYEQNRTSTENISGQDSCLNYDNKTDCIKKSDNIACVWVENKNAAGKNGGYCNVDKLEYVACGDAKDIPTVVPKLISFAVNLLKIATPIILIFVSIISLVKALAASNEDEIKKAQKSLIRKLVASAMIFFIISIVQFVILKVADNAEIGSISSCLSCVLNNDCEDTSYYRTVIAGEEYCTVIGTGERMQCDKIGNVYYVKTDYYEGEREDSCNGEYFTNSYQPKSIEDGGQCYALQHNGKYVTFKASGLDDESSWFTQKMWSANNKCYYWLGTSNSYQQIDCSNEVMNDYYIGSRYLVAEFYKKEDYFSNGYQPKGRRTVADELYKLTDTGKEIQVTKRKLSGEVVTKSQTLWEDSATCYYWSDMKNQYITIDCSATSVDDTK